jgi:hypothetical protein
MNQVRQALVRWTAKVLPSTKTHASTRTAADLCPLDADQLHQVAGGTAAKITTAAVDSPKGNW